MKPNFIAIVLYPFFFVGFLGLPIWKGRYMQLFQRINADFSMGMGWGGGVSMICYMSWLTVSIFICYVLFIYLFFIFIIIIVNFRI